MLRESNVVFIGAGNMAEAMVRGLLRAGLPAGRVCVTDIRPDRLDALQTACGVCSSADNASAASAADVVVLAVKPQMLPGVLQEIREALPPSALVISIAAGVRTTRIEQALGREVRVVRIMPNVAALVGRAASAICGGRHATAYDLELAAELAGASGVVVRVKEDDMDAVTAISGSGPAYVFFLVESMLASAAEFGLEPDVARRLVVATVAGAARLLEDTGLEARELRRRVTSEKGTTDAAIRTMEAREVPDALRAAFAAARRRSQELSA